MVYSIQEVAKQFGLTIHTLRYYDNQGFFPFLTRNSAGNRVFHKKDLDWVSLVCCLKDTGMSIKEIKQYCDWCKRGSETIDNRKAMLKEHRKVVNRNISLLKENLVIIDSKVAFYEQPDINQKLDEHLKIFQMSREN